MIPKAFVVTVTRHVTVISVGDTATGPLVWLWFVLYSRWQEKLVSSEAGENRQGLSLSHPRSQRPELPRGRPGHAHALFTTACRSDLAAGSQWWPCPRPPLSSSLVEGKPE